MDDGRPSALLTPAQREFLQDPEEPDNKAHARAMRSRIRSRIQEGLRDFQIIVERIEPEKIADAFEPAVLDNVIRSQVAFLYRLATSAGLDADDIFEQGIEQAKTSKAEVLLEQFREDPSNLTMGEVNLLYEKEKITDDKLTLQQWSTLNIVGKKRRKIPGGGYTPLMDPETFEEEGIGEMSEEELREKFGDGIPASKPHAAFYDGENIYYTSDEDE